MAVHPMMLGIVRIDATNKAVRAKVNGGADTTYLLTEGTYWLGLGITAFTDASAIGSSALGVTGSLLTNFATAVGWAPSLQFLDADGSPPKLGTGYIFVTPALNGDKIYWGDPLTTVRPEWFGMMPQAGSGLYSTFTAVGTGQQVLQNTFGQLLPPNSSSLAFVYRDSPPYDDRPWTRDLLKATEAQNGVIRRCLFGSRMRGLDLSWRVTQAPRETSDSTYHNLRRFLEELQLSRLGFVYIPSTALIAAPTPRWVWDGSDISTERFGWSRMTPVKGALERMTWDEKPKRQNYYGQWVKSLRVQQWV